MLRLPWLRVLRVSPPGWMWNRANRALRPEIRSRISRGCFPGTIPVRHARRCCALDVNGSGGWMGPWTTKINARIFSLVAQRTYGFVQTGDTRVLGYGLQEMHSKSQARKYSLPMTPAGENGPKKMSPTIFGEDCDDAARQRDWPERSCSAQSAARCACASTWPRSAR